MNTITLELTKEELEFIDECIGMMEMREVEEGSPEDTATEKIAKAFEQFEKGEK